MDISEEFTFLIESRNPIQLNHPYLSINPPHSNRSESQEHPLCFYNYIWLEFGTNRDQVAAESRELCQCRIRATVSTRNNPWNNKKGKRKMNISYPSYRETKEWKTFNTGYTRSLAETHQKYKLRVGFLSRSNVEPKWLGFKDKSYVALCLP